MAHAALGIIREVPLHPVVTMALLKLSVTRGTLFAVVESSGLTANVGMILAHRTDYTFMANLLTTHIAKGSLLERDGLAPRMRNWDLELHLLYKGTLDRQLLNTFVMTSEMAYLAHDSLIPQPP